MTTFYQWAVGWFDRTIDDICVVLDRLLAGLMAATSVLFALLTLASIFH